MSRAFHLIVAASVVALLAASPALAADDPVTPIPPVKEGIAPAITALVVFGIVMFILSTKVWPLITGGLDERNAKIREEIASAEAARAQAKAALAEYEASLAQARFEAQKMLDETRTEQVRLAAELKAMTGRGPMTIRALSRELGRDLKGVHGDVHALLDAGVLDRTEQGRILLPYDAVHVDFELEAA